MKFNLLYCTRLCAWERILDCAAAQTGSKLYKICFPVSSGDTQTSFTSARLLSTHLRQRVYIYIHHQEFQVRFSSTQHYTQSTNQAINHLTSQPNNQLLAHSPHSIPFSIHNSPLLICSYLPCNPRTNYKSLSFSLCIQRFALFHQQSLSKTLKIKSFSSLNPFS